MISFQVIPAIDLRDGRCVRLRQGDFGQETVFSDDPVAMARHWAEQGAERLHLVDLDGALKGRPLNLDSVRRIIAAVDVPCQVGGGIRDETAVRQLIDLVGADRVIVGTQALKDPDWFSRMAESFPRQVLLGLDARQGLISVGGWLEASEVKAEELAARYQDLPLAGIVYTNISLDGMLAGLDIETLKTLVALLETGLPIIASGGVTTAADVEMLGLLPLEGCIVGRALYEGTLTMTDARRALVRVARIRERYT